MACSQDQMNNNTYRNKKHFSGGTIIFYYSIYGTISKMIPTAPFTPRVITMSQCPIRVLDCRLNSRIP